MTRDDAPRYQPPSDFVPASRPARRKPGIVERNLRLRAAAAEGLPMKELARSFGLAPITIGFILRRSWA